MIREITPADLEQLAVDAILSGYGEPFAAAVVKAYLSRGMIEDLMRCIPAEDAEELGMHEDCFPPWHECPKPKMCPTAKAGLCYAD